MGNQWDKDTVSSSGLGMNESQMNETYEQMSGHKKKRRDKKNVDIKDYITRPCTLTLDSFHWMRNVLHSYRIHFVTYFNEPHRSNGSAAQHSTHTFYFINLKYDIYYIALLMIKLKIAWRRTYVPCMWNHTITCHP